MRVTKIVLTSVVSLVCSAMAGCEALGVKAAEYHPTIDPGNFQETINNPFYPLKPGTTWTYTEKARLKTSENVITVTENTKTIMGIKCTVVHDTVTTDGILAEDTYDWFAQDKQGNVWYFGEDTKEFKPGGRVITEGSWEAGVRGGQPGIIMPADPKPGEPYRQEYSRGNAEDMGQVVAVHQTVAVPYGTFDDCVRTTEWSLLESDTEKKWYARGVGFVRSESKSGEVAELVSMTK